MNWRTELEAMMADLEDELEVLVIRSEARPMAPMAAPIDYPVFDREFYPGHGGTEGCCFTAWGGKYVYFPAADDGGEWLECVPRNPCLVATTHIGL